jgi:hypothetical protein
VVRRPASGPVFSDPHVINYDPDLAC